MHAIESVHNTVKTHEDSIVHCEIIDDMKCIIDFQSDIYISFENSRVQKNDQEFTIASRDSIINRSISRKFGTKVSVLIYS